MSEEALAEGSAPPAAERLSDFTWYSRLLVWVGAVVLLVEAVSGRSVALFTVAAVLLLGFGLLAFLGGLVLDSLPPRPAAGPPRVTREEVSPAPPTEDAAPSADSAATLPAEVESTPVVDQPPTMPAPPVHAAPIGAVTSTVAPEDDLIGKLCLACQEPLRAGQTAAACPVCGSQHHATCWVGNRFHCARQGCDGHGGLIESAADPEPQGGPSKP